MHPSSLVLSGLTARHSDRSLLFGPLDLTIPAGVTGLVGANGAGKSTLLGLIAGKAAPAEGSVLLPGRVRLMRQEAGPDETVAGLFGVAAALARLRCALGGAFDDPEAVDWTLEERMDAALGRAGLAGVAPDRPVGTLSGGQRVRAALAALTFDDPEVILLDEPTNDLDAEGRAQVAAMLEGFRGVALVASHDRALLDRVDRILELEGGGARLFGGGWTAWSAAKAEAEARAEAALGRAERRVAEVAAAAARAETAKARSDRAGRRLRASGSQGKMLMDAQKERSENSGQGAARLRARQAEAAEAALDEAEEAVGRRRAMRFDLPPSRLPAGRRVLEMRGVGYGHPGAEPLRDVDLVLTVPERVRLTGPNGMGKSTLLALADGRILPEAGEVRATPNRVRLDQRLDALRGAGTVFDRFRAAWPAATPHAARAALARFHFRAARAEAPVAALSGGERLRAGLAIAFGGPVAPELLLLDEPTNHLDLESLDLLERALAAYDGAVLIVTHDEDFAARIAPRRSVALRRAATGCHIAVIEEA